LLPYFIPSDNYPVEKVDILERFKCNIVFAGHYENDKRVSCIEALMTAGFSVKLYGGGWDRAYSELCSDSSAIVLFPTFDSLELLSLTASDANFSLSSMSFFLDSFY
jgi:hypothetical protein